MRKITDVGYESNSVFSDRYACMLSRLYATPWTVACQASLPMGFSKQEYWNGLLCLPPGDLPDPGIEPMFLRLLNWHAGSLPLVPGGKP